MIPFAGLAPDERIARGSGELTALDLPAALAIGQQLRHDCRRATKTEEVAAAVVDAVNSFDHDRRPASVLVRAFVTQKVGSLPDDLRSQVAWIEPSPIAEAERLCLRLLATRGIEPGWNEVQRSVAHRVLPVDGTVAPMVSELARQLRLDDPARPPVSSFYVADPLASSAVPAKEFVTAYDLRSVFGFGATAWNGQTMIVVAFCRAPIDAATVRLFETVALYAELAWLGTDELRAAIGAEHARAVSDALDQMVTLQERHINDVFADYGRRLTEVRREAQRDAKAAAAAADGQASHLQRTQRAMLNLIEDLREARESLTKTVELRTRELAAANQKLEARNRELEEFVYIASHDLQEPLRTVAGYLQMVQRRYGKTLGVDADEFIQFAIEGAQRMQALIESLLLYSRVTSSDKQLAPLPLDEPLDIALRNLALRIEETHASVERTAPLPIVQGDRMQLVQVFQNLLSNAIKFAGGKPPRIRIAGAVADGMCTVTVRDEGIGFNPRFAERIFKIFRRLRRDTPGTGIGLAVCKKIVERHGGHIEATAQPNEGATFTIRIPVEPERGS